MSARRHPSAWEHVHGEAEQVSYWKWRVRQLEPLAVLAFLGGMIVGFIVCASFVPVA